MAEGERPYPGQEGQRSKGRADVGCWGIQAAALALQLLAFQLLALGDVSLGKWPTFDGRGAAKSVRQHLPCAGFRDGFQRMQLT